MAFGSDFNLYFPMLSRNFGNNGWEALQLFLEILTDIISTAFICIALRPPTTIALTFPSFSDSGDPFFS